MSSTSTPPPRYQDPFETWTDKFSRKFKENPWVPIGCAATCGALLMSAAKMRAGKSTEMNHWLRARVVLQGLTLVALVVGSMSIQNARKKEIDAKHIGEAEGGLPRNEAVTEMHRERNNDKAKEEFEERMREAEATTEMEQNAGFSTLRTVKGPAVNTVRREEERQKHQSPPESTPGATIDAVKSSKSWLWWSREKSPEPSNKTDPNSKA